MKREQLEEANKIYKKLVQIENLLNIYEAQPSKSFSLSYLEEVRTEKIPEELEEDILALLNKWKRKFEKQLKQI